VLNLKVSGIAAAAGFVLSLLIGVFTGGALGISLMRALFFGMVFFALGSAVWILVNRFIPELLMPPEEEPLMAGLETGSRVNISVGDDDISINAAIPPEDGAKDDLGNVAELVSRRSQPAAAGAFVPGGPGMDDIPVSGMDFGPAAESPDPAAGAMALDLGAKDGYSKEATGLPLGAEPQTGASMSALAPPAGGSGGGDPVGSLDALPDLDAMAGTFLSSGEEAGEETAATTSILDAGPRRPLSAKAKGPEADYNPKEVASAIQTILKRD
jgi:hypothetical protein